MTGSTLYLILISVVFVIVLAVCIVLVFYADAHPAGRREAPAQHGTADQAARPPAGRPEYSPDAAPGQTQASPSPTRDTGVPAERAAAGTAAGKTRAA
jgi:cytoskeletal protein RodZ